MKKLITAAFVCTTVFFMSCNSTDNSNPKSVLMSFFDALSKKDIAGARKLATAESKSMLDVIEMGMKMGGEDKKEEKYDKSKMEFGEAKIEGDKATVAVKDKNSGETTNYTLKKEGGAWKVAFDKSSMMNMGADKMKEHGDDMMNEGTDKIKESMDSLGNKMKEAMDSIK